ncbi:MAG: DNA internalization-related competence protein ComEC/Rec2 [Acidiferrobacterales bacterium]
MRICSIAFLLGILLVQQLTQLPSLWWSLALIPIAWLSLQRPAWLPIFFLLAGVCWASLRAGWILEDELPAQFEGKDMRVEGYVAGIPQMMERGTRFRFDVKHASRKGVRVKIPGTILLTSYDDAHRFGVGEHWRFTVRLKRPHGFQNPGGFDYEGYLFRERVRATGYVRGKKSPELLGSGSGAYMIDRLRQRLGERVRYLLADNPASGLALALVNGDRRGITDNQWTTLRRTGTNHLVAISGLHVGLVAGLAFFVARFLWALPGWTVLRWPAPKVGAIAAMMFALMYSALAGFAVPTQRAMIMLTVVMGAVLFQRRLAPTQVLAIALFLVLVHDPLAVMGAGFWLSFAAVTVIILFVYRHSVEGNLWQRLGYVQWAIAVGLLPLMLMFFQQVSLIGPIANMVAVPIFGLLVVPFTLVAAVLSAVLPDALARFVLQLGLWPLEMVWAVLEYLARFEHSLWIQSRPSIWAFACGLIGAAILLAPRGWPARWLGVVWLSPLLFIRPCGPGPGEVWLSLLDVGQGLAAVVRTHTHTLVYDTGPRFSARFDAGRAVVVPFLRSQGLAQIDTLIISHGDNDHIGGARSVLESMLVRKLLTSVPEKLPNARACRLGESWDWDAVKFTILHPPADYPLYGNNASCVVRVASRYGNILLPGDIEAVAEQELIQQNEARIAADVLVVPHQGSKTSSTEPFLDAVRPEVALFPVGYRNRYRHPHMDVKARYTELGAKLYTSPEHGEIQVRLGANGIEVLSYRHRNRRYWFNQ